MASLPPGMTAAQYKQSVFEQGPWLIGCLIDIFLQGVLCAQFAHYYSWRREDKPVTQLMVLGLAILTTLKSVHTVATCWILFILDFQDISKAILSNYVEWWKAGSGLMVATIGIYVQAFFCYRIYVISKGNWWFIVPIVACLALGYAAVCVATWEISLGAKASHQIGVWFAVHFSSVFAGDWMVTLTTAFFLLRSRKEVLPQTAGLIDALVRLTFQTAAPAALCAMFNLIFSQVYSGKNKLISSGFNQALPKLYAFSMMWTLNARRELRIASTKRPVQCTSDDPSVTGQTKSEHVDIGSYAAAVHVTQSKAHTISDIGNMFRKHSLSKMESAETNVEDDKMTESA